MANPQVLLINTCKGGNAKTVSSLVFAIFLAELNKKVLCVDLDAQGNLSKMLNQGQELKPGNLEREVKGIYELLIDKEPAERIIRRTEFVKLNRNIDYIPSGTMFRKRDVASLLSQTQGRIETWIDILWRHNTLSEETKSEILCALPSFHNLSKHEIAAIARNDTATMDPKIILKTQLEPIKRRYDWIIIDSAPTRSLLSFNALIASDYVLCPAILDGFSEDAMADLMDNIRYVNENYNDKLGFAGVLFTIVNANTRLSRAQYQRLWSIFDDPENDIIARVIRDDAMIKESETYGVPIPFWGKRSKACTDYIYAAESIGLIDKKEMKTLLKLHGISNDNYNFGLLK